MEKFTTEDIEKYLEGKLNDTDRYAFETALSLNQELKDEVNLQKALVKQIEREAWQALVQDAHSRYTKNSKWNINGTNTKWFLGLLSGIIVITGVWLLINQSSDNKITTKDEIKAPTASSISIVETKVNTIPKVEFSTYTFLAEKGATIKDNRSGAIIVIPANAMIDQNGNVIQGKVTLKYREFRNQADIALSHLPMIFEHYNFNSAGMFEIIGLKDQDTLGIAQGQSIQIDFTMTKNEPGIGFYFLNPKTNQWEFIRPLDKMEENASMVSAKKTNEIDPATLDRINYSDKLSVIPDLIDPLKRSLGYHEAVIEGKDVMPILPKDTNTLNEQFNNKAFNKPAGADTGYWKPEKSSRGNSDKQKKSWFAEFWKRIFAGQNAIIVQMGKKDTSSKNSSFYVLDGNKKYAFGKTLDKAILTELDALKGVEFIYNGQNNLSDLDNQEIFDLRLTKDSKAFNKFLLELKTDKKIYKYSVSLKGNGKQMDFTPYENYEHERKMRMMTFDEKAKEVKKQYNHLLQLTKERSKMLDSLTKYGDDNLYQMARLIMNKKELQMSKEDWYASLNKNSELANRIKNHLDSINYYGANADDYIQKLVNKTNTRMEDIRNSFRNKNDFLGNRLDQANMNSQSMGNMNSPIFINPSSSVYYNYIQRLTIQGFGIYNCDQIYRLKPAISISAEFYNENDEAIKRPTCLSVIDAKVNAAFTFIPPVFECSSTSKTSLLLFTFDNRIYYLNSTEWAANEIKKSGKYQFKLKDITEQVKSPKDLQSILESQSL